MERTRVDEQRGREEEGWSGREKERKREKPSRELDGSRATIRRGDFTERGSCWSPRRRHKRGSETDSGREKDTEKRGIHTQKKRKRDRKRNKILGVVWQRNNINMRDRQTEKKDQKKKLQRMIKRVESPCVQTTSQTKLKMHQAIFYTFLHIC